MLSPKTSRQAAAVVSGLQPKLVIHAPFAGDEQELTTILAADNTRTCTIILVFIDFKLHIFYQLLLNLRY